MRIHTVKEGESIFDIARQYSTAPSFIVEDNGLTSPERLATGEKLVIFTPTRTHTVRGGDSLESIALRYGVSRASLIAANPRLMGADRIHPGQIIAVKYDVPKYGLGIANGFYKEGTGEARLECVLPYLYYVSFPVFVCEGEEIRSRFSPVKAVNYVREHGKIPLAFIECKEKLGREKYENFIRIATNTVKIAGYAGVGIKHDILENELDLPEFLLALKKELMANDLLLSLELEGIRNDAEALTEICDTVLLKTNGEADRDGNGHREFDLISEYAQRAGCEKTMLSIPTLARAGDDEWELDEAYQMAKRCGAKIEYDEKSMMCHFKCNIYSGGRRQETKVSFEAPENTKAKLDLVGELGYMGISFDIMSVPMGSLMLFHTSFHSMPECVMLRYMS